MNTRIFSWFVDRATTVAVMTTATWLLSVPSAEAQTGAGYYTDPATGIVYQKVTRTVDRPVVETQVQQQEQLLYRPQTVTETKPESRTVYTPVVEYRWEPRITGRWNPFRQPTVSYHHVPRAHWEARNEVVQRTNTRTEWVAEKRTVDVPKRIVRMQREQKVDYEVVGRVTPQQAQPPSGSSTIASRLRPLDSNTSVQPIYPSTGLAASTFSAPRIAASTVGRMASDPPRRTAGQSGMRATELTPSGTIHSQALPPVSGGVGMANMRALPFFR